MGGATFERKFQIGPTQYVFHGEPDGTIDFAFCSGKTIHGDFVIQLDMFGDEEHLGCSLGGGQPFLVLGEVKKCILAFVSSRRPACIQFRAVEPKRRRVYLKLLKRLLPKLPDYEVSILDNGGYFLLCRRHESQRHNMCQ